MRIAWRQHSGQSDIAAGTRRLPPLTAVCPAPFPFPHGPGYRTHDTLSVKIAQKERLPMSFNPPLDTMAVQQALRELGKQTRAPTTAYLFGGSVLLLRGLRQGATQDLDLWSYDNNAALDTAVQVVKRTNVSIDFLDPAAFLPLPDGWETRSTFAGSYGQLQVYYLDPYAIALSKIGRAQPKDVNDVQLLAQYGLITRDELLRLYQTIQPQLGTGMYLGIDPAAYDGKLHQMLQVLGW